MEEDATALRLLQRNGEADESAFRKLVDCAIYRAIKVCGVPRPRPLPGVSTASQKSQSRMKGKTYSHGLRPEEGAVRRTQDFGCGEGT